MDLINTKSKPDGFIEAWAQAMQAAAYHALDPYPMWNFHDWKTEDKGPHPRCMPLPRHIVSKGASWLFGKPFQIVSENEKLQESLRDAWLQSRMQTKIRYAAELGGIQGGVALKWAYDESNKDRPVAFQVLSVVDHLRLYYDPHDQDKLLMARVQYTYFDYERNQYYWYREEWTDEFEVHYVPRMAVYKKQNVSGAHAQVGVAQLADGASMNADPDTDENWQILTQKPNPFGVIPICAGKNIDVGSTWGQGDLWPFFRVFDRLNLAYHLMDRSNQLDSDPTTVAMDVSPEADDLDRVGKPGSIVSVKSDETADGKPKQGRVELLEPSGRLRPYMKEYADDVRAMIMDAARSVEVRQEDVSNKGNMTQAVLMQLYAPLISATDEKRQTYGEDWITKFLELASIGLKNAGAKGFETVNEDVEDSYDIELKWPDYFMLTDEEKAQRVNRMTAEETAGYITHDRAVARIAEMEGISDLDALKAELEEQELETENVPDDQEENPKNEEKQRSR